MDISIEALLIEQNQDKSKDLKLSVKYGVISYIIIFIISMIINSFRIDFSQVLQQGNLEIVKALGIQFINNNLLVLPPAIIIAFMFYFYIFPNKKGDE